MACIKSKHERHPSHDRVHTRAAHIIKRVEADGVTDFYREAGHPKAPVVLLLHGFPASSFMYRELIPRLADTYRVIAPDLPGFGFTNVPVKRAYKYSFDALARTIAHLQTLCISGITPFTSSTTELRPAFG